MMIAPIANMIAATVAVTTTRTMPGGRPASEAGFHRTDTVRLG
jgi:hypothetical protein